MLKDITLGQFFPGSSPVHRLDPRAKLVLLVVFIVAIFSAKGLSANAACLVGVCGCVAVSRIKPTLILKALKPIIFLVLFTAALNVLYTPGRALASFWIFTITAEGIAQGFYMSLRIILLITCTSLLTYTTSPIALTDGMERLMGPLKKIKVPVHDFAMMMTIALRFIPDLISETDKIMSAQKSRGADFDSGNLVRRAKALIPVLVPLFISAFRRADELAVAMECRLYRGDSGRTRLHVLRYSRLDALAGLICCAFCAAVMAASRLLP